MTQGLQSDTDTREFKGDAIRVAEVGDKTANHVARVRGFKLPITC